MISYKEIRKWVKNLAKQIKKDWMEYEILVIIARWWLIGWYWLAKELWIKEIVVLNYVSYQQKTQWVLVDNNTVVPRHFWEWRRVLIFDDLVDSGITISKARRCVGWFINVACLYLKEWATRLPNFYYKKRPEKKRIDFIYEQK